MTQNCKGTLQFDGSGVGLLNMRLFCMTHEVLRNHMHHFLTGR